MTAFRFAASSEFDPEISTPLIRLSFKTDRPFFPYREPQAPSAENPGRSLRIYLFSTGRMQAASGHFGKSNTWPGNVQWSDNIKQHAARVKHFESPIATQLALPETTLQKAQWMTVFDDFSAHRQGADDVYFIPANNKSKLPDPIIKRKINTTFIPVELIAILCIGGITLFSLLIKLRRVKHSA